MSVSNTARDYDSEGGLAKNSQNKTAQEHHRKLNEQRATESKLKMRQSNESKKGKGSSSTKTEKKRKKETNMQKALDVKRQAQTAVALGSAFTAIDPLKDMVHLMVIGIAILADLCTIIPLIGSLIAIIFMLATWILYGLHGHFKKSPEKKIVTMMICYIVELIFSTTPTFLISAVANYWLALADRKVDQKKATGEIN